MDCWLVKVDKSETYLTGLLQVEVVGGDAREGHDQSCEEGERLHSDVPPNHLGLRQHPLREGHCYLSVSVPTALLHR